MAAMLLIVIVCFGASIIGAICGIGGGVIIKPVLDATGVMSVTTISFLSGCTVLSMSLVSMYKNFRQKRSFDSLFAIILASGSVIGGILGKALFQKLVEGMSNTNRIGAVQAAVLLVITLGTMVYTIFKEKIPTKNMTNKFLIFTIGCALGIMSSFLGIGGGPINLVVLFYFFSMETKQAAVYSLFTIMCSQVASLFSTIIGGNVPEFKVHILILMVICGITGGLAGSRINKKIDNNTVDKLFMGLMVIIMIINVYNIFRYV